MTSVMKQDQSPIVQFILGFFFGAVVFILIAAAATIFFTGSPLLLQQPVLHRTDQLRPRLRICPLESSLVGTGLGAFDRAAFHPPD